jgi:phosphopantothenoylcysteine decarboxylase/phosphopantothenate--cysteine ligase
MNVLVGVTGSIAIYKTLELIRLFIKNGDKVKIIMSESAKKFITPLTFETISQSKVLDDTNEDWSNDFNHIGIGKWADIYIIAPATANTVNKINSGIADNILLSTYLAFTKTKLIAPAANTNMYLNPITQNSLKNLNIIEANSGLLACGDDGVGKMAEPIEIFHRAIREVEKSSFWENRNVIVTAGGTTEKIDDVRFISNFSTGKMGEALALALYYKGANVTLISTKSHNIPKEINLVKALSSQEIKNEIDKKLTLFNNSLFEDKSSLNNEPHENNYETNKCSYLFMAAAISDYIPTPQKGKLKKENIGDVWNLEIHQNIDILASIKDSKIKKIGFKAESDENRAYESAKKALINKNLDAICLNLISKNYFGSDENEVIFITKDSNTKLPQNSKIEIAKMIIKESEKL